MKVVLSPSAARYLERMNEPFKGRVKDALGKLSVNPPQGDIKPLTGKHGYRLRVGGYRILFGMDGNIIVVTDIVPRGQAYRGR